MKTYTLKGRNGKPDIDFTLDDLIPVPQKKRYDFFGLVALINEQDYQAVAPFKDEDYWQLYRDHAHTARDFFRIRDTGVIVIPGNSIFPTTLTAADLI